MIREVVLLSGGYDSAILLHRAVSPLALFVDYGQRAVAEERAACVQLCERVKCELRQVRIDLDAQAMNTEPGAPGPRVVGGRNVALISLGVNVAVSTGRQTVWIGAQGGDDADYPDCRPVFIDAIGRLMRTTYGVNVEAPLLHASTHAMRAEASLYRLRGITWSCYAPSAPGVPCGACASCRQVR